MIRRGSVRSRILTNSGLILVLMAAASLYSGLASWEQDRNVESLFRADFELEKLRETLAQTHTAFTGYLRTKVSDTLGDYLRASTALAEEARAFQEPPSADELVLLRRNLAATVASYLASAEAGIQAKRARDVVRYAERADEASAHLAAALRLIGELQQRSLARSLEGFSRYRLLLPWVFWSGLLISVGALALAFALLWEHSRRLTDPLTRLAEAALAVGRGDLGVPIPEVTARDEIGTLAETFRVMLFNLRRSFTDIQARAQAERDLLQERMRVLELDHRLKDAELLALQTQINPHFLFNTLSAGIELAATEEALRTEDFLQNLARFIRYSLTPPGHLVLLADEFEAVGRYVWLLRQRFRDRFHFVVEADPSLANLEMPALLLQPLVENAVGHGLADREEGGEVTVTARAEAGWAVLTVRDNGRGLEAHQRRLLEAEAWKSEPSAPGDGEHGIGLRNVLRRVVLATAGRGRIELRETPGGGLEVRLALPLGGVEVPT